MLGNSPYGAIEVEMLAEANRMISDDLTEARENAVAAQSNPDHGLRQVFTNLWRRRHHLRPQHAGFQHEAKPCVEC